MVLEVEPSLRGQEKRMSARVSTPGSNERCSQRKASSALKAEDSAVLPSQAQSSLGSPRPSAVRSSVMFAEESTTATIVDGPSTRSRSTVGWSTSADDSVVEEPSKDRRRTMISIEENDSMRWSTLKQVAAKIEEKSNPLDSRRSTKQRRSSSKNRSSTAHGDDPATNATVKNLTSTPIEQEPEILRLSAQTMKTWNMKQKNASIPHEKKRYALPEPRTQLSQFSKKSVRRARDSIDMSDMDGPGGTRASNLSLVRIALKDGHHTYRLQKTGGESDSDSDELGFEALGPGESREQLSIYEAAQQLAEANISIGAVKDVLKRLQEQASDPKKHITREYLATQHLYGTMCDYLRDLWTATTKLGDHVDKDLEVDKNLMPRPRDAMEGYRVRDSIEIEMQRERLARWLKMVLESLNGLNWEHTKLDFARWVKTTTANDEILKDALELISDHMDEALNLLTISRYAIEESLGSHLVIAADNLTQFYQEMKKWTDQALAKRGPRTHRDAATHNARLQQLLAIAQDERDRQRRNLEMNASLRFKMAQAMNITDDEEKKEGKSKYLGMEGHTNTMKTAMSITADINNKIRKPGNTIIVAAPGVDVPGKNVMKPHIEITQKRPRPNVHIEVMFMRCIHKAREMLDVVNASTRDRQEHIRHITLLYRQRAKAQRRAQRRARSGSDVGLHTTKNLLSVDDDMWANVQTLSIAIPDDGIDPTELDYNDVEIQWLVQRKSELAEKLNSATIPVSLAGIWGKSRYQTVRKDEARWTKRFGRGKSGAKLAEDRSGNTSRRQSHSASPYKRQVSISDDTESASSSSPTGSKTTLLSPTSERRQKRGIMKRASRFDSSPGDISAPPSARSSISMSALPSEDFSRQNTLASKRNSVASSPRGDRPRPIEIAAGVGDGSMDLLLEKLVELEAKDSKRGRQYARLCRDIDKVLSRVDKRFGDVWRYDADNHKVWFKKNPRQPIVDSLWRETTLFLGRGTLMLGRKGEADLKDLRTELLSLTKSLEQEDRERLRCCDASVGFNEAAWHFRVNHGLQELVKRFGPMWAALKERISFGSTLHPTSTRQPLKRTVTGGSSNCSDDEGFGTDELFEQYQTLATNLTKIERDAMIRRELSTKMKEESDRLETKKKNMKAFIAKLEEFHRMRDLVFNMRSEKRGLQKELWTVTQDLKDITLGRDRDKSIFRGSIDDEEEERARAGAALKASSARTAQEMLKYLHEKMLSHNGVQSYLAPIFRGEKKRKKARRGQKTSTSGSREHALQMNTEKLIEMKEHMLKAQAILKVRAERKKEDLRKMITKISRSDKILPLSQEELKAKWDKEMAEFRSKLANFNRMAKFWEDRLAHWYEEVLSSYGKDVQIALKDETRHDHKEGNLALATAIHSKFAQENNFMVSPTSSHQPASRHVLKSLVFEQAMQTLTEIDSIRQVSSDLRRSGGLLMMAENRLSDLPPEMMQQMKKLQAAMEKEDMSPRGNLHNVAKPLVSLPTVFGGRNSKRKSGHLYRSTLGRSLKRGTTIRDRVMQIFMKANVNQPGVYGGGGDSSPRRLLRSERERGSFQKAALTRLQRRNFSEMSPLSISGQNQEMEKKRKEEEEKQNQKLKDEAQNDQSRPRRLSVTFQEDQGSDDGIYDDDGDSDISDEVESELRRRRRKKRRQSESSDRPSSAESARSHRSDRSRVSGVSGTSSSVSRRKRDDDGSMSESNDKIRDRSRALQKKRRRAQNFDDPDASGTRVHMLRLFMEDASQGQSEDSPKVKNTRFKTRASVIVEGSPTKDGRRPISSFLKEISRRQRVNSQVSLSRRSDRRQMLAEEKRGTAMSDLDDFSLFGTKEVITPRKAFRGTDVSTTSSDRFNMRKSKTSESLTKEERPVVTRRKSFWVPRTSREGQTDDQSSESSTSGSSDSRKVEDLDLVLEGLEEEEECDRSSLAEDSRGAEMYTTSTYQPQLGLRLLRTCRDRMLQEFTSFEKAYDRAAAHGAQKHRGRHRSSILRTINRPEKPVLLTSDGFAWLASIMGYGEDDALAIFQHLVFAGGAETVDEDTITEGDEEHGPSVSRDGFVQALRFSLPLNNLSQLRTRLHQRYGRLDDLFETSSDGGGEMTLAAFCTLCESVGATVKEASRLYGQIEFHNESPPEYVGRQTQVTKRAFLLSLKHAEALAAARRLATRLDTMPRPTATDAFDKFEPDEFSAASVGGKKVAMAASGDDNFFPDDFNQKKSSTEEGEEEEEGHSLQTSEKVASLYQIFLHAVDKKYHTQPLSLDGMRTAVKSLVPFSGDVRLLFNLVQRPTNNGDMRGRIQDFALRALGGLGYRFKALAEAVGYKSTAQQGATRGNRYNVAASRMERLAAKRARLRRANTAGNMLAISGNASATDADDSGFVGDESGFGESSGSDAWPIKEHDFCLASAQQRSMQPRRGRAALAKEVAKFCGRGIVRKQRHSWSADLERRRRQRRQLATRGPAQSTTAGKQPADDAQLADDNEENSDEEEQPGEATRQDAKPLSLPIAGRRGDAMRKKSVINTDRVSLFSSDGHVRGSIAELPERKGTNPELGELMGAAPNPGDSVGLSDTWPVRRKKSVFGGQRPGADETPSPTRPAKRRVSMMMYKGRSAAAGAEDQEGKLGSKAKERRESVSFQGNNAAALFDSLRLGGASTPTGTASMELGDDMHMITRAARPGMALRQQTMKQLKKQPSLDVEASPAGNTEGLAKRRLRHGHTCDASQLLVGHKEEEDDADLWKWKEDGDETGRNGNRFGPAKSEHRRSFFGMSPVVSDSLTPASYRKRPSFESPSPSPMPEVTEAPAFPLDEGWDDAASSSASATENEGSASSTAFVEAKPFDVELAKKRKAVETLEAGRHRKRLDLFESDQTELQIATQRLQDFRVRLLLRFRTPAKAFELLAGSRDAKLPVAALNTKVEKILSFNPLDAKRVVSVLAAVEEAPELCYNEFLNVMRFAAPVHSILEFRTRLVQRYSQVECAFRVFGFTDNIDLDVGLFERPMLGAGVASNDAHRLFRVADTAQPGGSRGHLSLAGLRFALDHAHVLAWLEAFHARVAAAKGRAGQSVREAIAGAGKHNAAGDVAGDKGVDTPEDEPIASAEHFQALLRSLEFPAEFAADTFAFLQRRNPQVTLAGLAQMVHHAFGTEARRHAAPSKTSASGSMKQGPAGQQDQGAPMVGFMAKKAAKAKAKAASRAEIGVVASTAQPLTAAAGGMGTLSASGAPTGPGTGASASHGGEHHGAVRVTEEVREEALVQTRRLRRHVMTHFANYQEAYHVFKRKSPLDGIALDEWMEAMDAFSFADPAGWEQIFGHIVDWRHMRWDPRYRGTEGRVTLARLANSLDHAAPCTTPVALRKVLQEKYGTMQKAWVQLSGREGVEELSMAVWQQAMHKIAVVAEDAGHLHTILRAAPIAERIPDNQNQQLSRVAFLTIMRSAEAVTRLFDLLLRLSTMGPSSCAFEARVYPPEPLAAAAFEEQLADMMHASEAKLLFSYLDVNQEGFVSICDLLDALTIMQGMYLPYVDPHAVPVQGKDESGPTELPVVPAHSPNDPPEFPSQSPEGIESLTSLRAAAGSTDTIGATMNATMNAPISPTDFKGRSDCGFNSPSSPYDDRLQNASTALPESIFSETPRSEDDSDRDPPQHQQRPWTSMSTVGIAGRTSLSSGLHGIGGPPPRAGGSALGFAQGSVAGMRASAIGARGGASENQGAFTHAPFLPHLNLAAAAASRASVQGWEQVLHGPRRDSAPQSHDESEHQGGSALGNDLRHYVEDHMSRPHLDMANRPSVGAPRPHSVLAASSDRDISSGPAPPRPHSVAAGPSLQPAAMPRPHSVAAGPMLPSAAMPRAESVAEHSELRNFSDRGRPSLAGPAATALQDARASLSRDAAARTERALPSARTNTASPRGTLEVTSHVAPTTRGQQRTSAPGAAQRSPPLVLHNQDAVRAASPRSALGQAGQSGSSALPAVGRASVGRSAGGKRSSSGPGKKRSGGIGNASARH